MKAKAFDMYSNSIDVYDHREFYSTSMEGPCKKHPSLSPVGICAYCLKERLVNLVCSDCGEQRFSSCSCSEIMSNRNSSAFDVSSVGRISFMLENDKKIDALESNSNSGVNNNQVKLGNQEDAILKRSNSSCVEIKRRGGLWKIKRLFSKKRSEKSVACERSNSVHGVYGFQETKSDNGLWLVDYTGVSRSRSLCSFRGGGNGGAGFFGSEDGTFSGARSSISGARSSISAARNSGVNGVLLFDPDRKSGFSEAEPRKSNFGFDNSVLDPEKIESRRVFSLKEGNFSTGDDSAFIDLKFDHDQDMSSSKLGGFSDLSLGVDSVRGGEIFGHHGGSCRVSVSDMRGIKRSRKSFKSWRWIFRQHSIPKTKDEYLHD